MHIFNFSIKQTNQKTFPLEASYLENKNLIVFETFKVVIKANIFVKVVVLCS